MKWVLEKKKKEIRKNVKGILLLDPQKVTDYFKQWNSLQIYAEPDNLGTKVESLGGSRCFSQGKVQKYIKKVKCEFNMEIGG